MFFNKKDNRREFKISISGAVPSQEMDKVNNLAKDLSKNITKEESRHNMENPVNPLDSDNNLREEIKYLKKLIEDFGIDKLSRQQQELTAKNDELLLQIKSKEALISELEVQAKKIIHDVVDEGRRKIEAYSQKFITNFINNSK